MQGSSCFNMVLCISCILVSEEDEEAIVVEPSKRGKLFFLSVA